MKRIHIIIPALSLMAMRGPIHLSSVRFDKEDPMDDAEFQQQVLAEAKKVKKSLDELTTKYDNLEKSTKKDTEDLLKKLKDSTTKAEEIEVANKKLNLQMTRERSNALGTPIQRITGNDESLARMAASFALGHKTTEGNALAMKIAKDFGLVAKAEGEDSGFGASLITPDLARDIYDTLPTYGAWPVLGYRRLGTKVTEMPVKTARAQAGFITAEGAAIPEDTAKDGTSVTATARPIGTLLSVSLQLLEDSPLAVVADIMDDFLEGNAQCMDVAGFTGNGTLDYTNGGFTGLFNGGTAFVAPTGHNSFAEITYDDILNMMLSVDVVVLQRQARWFMHPFILVKIMGIKDGNGRPIFQSILERPAPNAIGSMLGYPITLVSNAPFTDGASKKMLAFGDPQSQVMGVRTDFSFGFSDDYHFNTYQRAYRGISRIASATRRAQAFSVMTTAAS